MAPRKRKPEDQWMPGRVYRGKSAYEWRPPGGGAVRLCALDADKAEVWLRYNEEIANNSPAKSLAWLLGKYQQSDKFAELAASTRDSYAIHIKTIINTRTSGGGSFGKALLVDISPGVIKKYLDRRGKDGAKVAANREKAVMGAAFSWAYERDMVSSNPVKGVKGFKEEGRKRYVTDEEYEAVRKLATPRIAAMMEVAYLCRLRRSEVVGLTRADIQDDGLFARRLKGSKDAVTRWSDRLRAAVNTGINEPSQVSTMYVFHDRFGQPVKPKSLGAAWGKLMKAAVAQGIARFTFHDLKAKGVSDFDGDKQAASGHKTAAMVARYDRKTPVVDPTK